MTTANSHQWRQLIGFAVVAVVSVVGVAYHAAPDNGFHFDDRRNIVECDAIHVTELTVSNLYSAVSGSATAGRPFSNLTLALDWWRGGGAARPFIWTNIVIHGLCAVAVLMLLLVVLGQLKWSERERLVASVVGASLWAAHPIQVQAVTYVVQRMASLATLFVILSVIFFLLARIRSGTHWWVLAGMSLMLGLLCKENAAIIPILWLLAEYGVVRHGRGLEPGRADKGIWIVLCVAALYGLADLTVLHGPLSGFLSRGYGARDFTMLERVITQPRVVMIHLGQLVWAAPDNFSLEHDLRHSTSLMSPPTTLAAIAAAVVWIAGGGWLFLQRRRRVLGFFLLWVPVTLAIESSVVGLELVFEHRMYLPTVGLAGLTSLGVAHTYRAGGRLRPTVLAASVLVVALLVASTNERVPVWKDEITLYEQAVRFAPNSPRAHYNLATFYAKADRNAEAKAAFDQTLQLDPKHVKGFFNRGVLLATKLGRLQEAIADYSRVLEHDPQYLQAWVNRGTIFDGQGRLVLARKDYAAVIGICNVKRGLGELKSEELQHCAAASNNRGLLRRNLGDHRGALDDFSSALADQPTLVGALVNRATVNLLLGQTEPALRDLSTAIELEPANGKAHIRMGLAYRMMGNVGRATRSFRVACQAGYQQACAKLPPS